MSNIAYVDGQNLHLGTKGMTEYAWHVDLTKFRVYLRQKYDIQKAYYYLGYIQDDHKIEQLYEEV